jgi:hypothetical protein
MCNCFRVGRGYLSNGVRANGYERSLFGCFHVLWVNAGGGVGCFDFGSREHRISVAGVSLESDRAQVGLAKTLIFS